MSELDQPVFLWVHPRSVSTAFERVFIERGDFDVFHEPFSQAFFFGEERGHARFADQPPRAGLRYREVWNRILSPSASPARRRFVKELAFHMRPPLRQEIIEASVNTFLIRHPRKALASMHRMLPDFDWVEAGYECLLEIFTATKALRREPVHVVDADDLRREPDAVIQAYCQHLGVDFMPRSLRWEPKVVPKWSEWAGWHDDAQFSEGLRPEPQESGPPLPDRVLRLVERALPYYDAMIAHAVRP